jgi:hypothetical protein
VDWVVLGSMLVDVGLFAVHVAPWLRTRASSGGGFLALLVMLALVWLGPFLGLLRRRGRGAALLSYAVLKLSIALGIIGWWWGHRFADHSVSPAPLAAPIVWNILGAAASLAALAWPPRAPSTAQANIVATRDS